MDFVKKHYEKILLSVVLLGLLGALVFMLIYIPEQRAKDTADSEHILTPKVVALPDLDMNAESNVVDRVQLPYQLDFDTTNKLFNPVEWQRAPDGKLFKAMGAGPQAAVVTNITPLYFILTLDSVDISVLGVRYVIGVERQASMNPAISHRQTRYAAPGEKKDLFTITKVVGKPENPDALILKLADTGEEVTLSKSQPYRRVDGYMADLKYDRENRSWTRRRVGDALRFARDEFTIVDIESNSVIISAQSNQRRWTLRYAP